MSLLDKDLNINEWNIIENFIKSYYVIFIGKISDDLLYFDVPNLNINNILSKPEQYIIGLKWKDNKAYVTIIDLLIYENKSGPQWPNGFCPLYSHDMKRILYYIKEL